jgi:hypothetical protein
MHTVHISFLRPFFGKSGLVYEAKSMREAKAALSDARRYGALIESFTDERGTYICDAVGSPMHFLASYVAEEIPF